MNFAAPTLFLRCKVMTLDPKSGEDKLGRANLDPIIRM